MINREILFERNMTGSYMKIPANINAAFDEKMIFKKKIPGILPMEKTFMYNSAYFWYNISGKQSFELYCKVRDIGIDLVEKLIISICNQLEILEWNLLSPESLVLDMELIFLNSENKEFIFTVYPGAKGDIQKDFRQLMEILITKVNHKDMEAVHAAYEIYEKTLDENITILQIRDELISAKESQVKERVEITPVPEVLPLKEESPKKLSRWQKLKALAFEKLQPFIDKVMPEVKEKTSKKERQSERPVVQTVVYEKEKEPVLVDYPTVLLSEEMNKPKGILVYEGGEGFRNILIKEDVVHIGKGDAADVEIDRNTISHLHAKIEHDGSGYYIVDMNSRNGTFVNHEMIAYKERRLLKKNDIVCFADVQYRFS